MHAPAAVKLTGRPELAVALTVKSASPTVLSASAPNVIVWLTLEMIRVPVPLGSGPVPDACTVKL